MVVTNKLLERVTSFYKMLRLSQEDTEAYCRNKRYEHYKNHGAYIFHLPGHSVIHCLLVFVLKIQRWSKKQKINVIADKRVPTNRPIIFAGTHIGGDDIETAFEAIRTPCWLLLGDPKEIYRNEAGLMLDLNGVICFDTAHKQDRKIAKERCIALLKKGGNLLMFPEGAWNISPNQPVMHLFPGAVEMARECDADIVPFAVGRNGKTYYVNIGANIRFDKDDPTGKYELTAMLRNTLATLKWEIIEKIPPLKRNEMPDDYGQKYLGEVMGTQVATYSVQDVLDTKFNPKGQVEPTEAFAIFDQMKPSFQNAYLFNKRLT